MRSKQKYFVLYDGYCLLCSRARTFVEKFDWLHTIETVDLYDTRRIQELHLPISSPEELLTEIHLIHLDGKIYRGFSACRKIGMLLPITFLPSLFLYIPFIAHIGDSLYTHISRTRTRKN